MLFDYAFNPFKTDEKLSPIVREQMHQTREHWRRLGLSVQFINSVGRLTEWSFRTAAARDAFIAKNLAGQPYAVSEADNAQ